MRSRAFPKASPSIDADDRCWSATRSTPQLYGAGQDAQRELPGVPYRGDRAELRSRSRCVPPEYADRRVQWLEERLRAGAAAPAGRAPSTSCATAAGCRALFVRSARRRHRQRVHRRHRTAARAGRLPARFSPRRTLVLDTLPVGVAFLADRVIVRCNRRLERMLGYAPAN